MELLRRLIEDRILLSHSRRPALALLVVLGICGACGDDSTEGSSNALRVVQEWSTQTVERQGEEPTVPLALLDTVHVSATETGSRIVFGFRQNSLPGYTVRRTDAPLRQCGSGQPVELGGPKVLEVRFKSARAHTETGTSTLAQRDWEAASPNGAQAAIACDFEGQVVWGLGLSEAATYRVLSDSTTGRLALEVRW